MSFKLRLIMIVLVAVVALAGVNFGALNQVRMVEREYLDDRRELGQDVVKMQISRVFTELDSAAINLSKPREIVTALAASDNEALYDWSASFVGGEHQASNISSIAFVGLEGFVVARAPDEFRFGDNLADTKVFRRTMSTGGFLGTAWVDNQPCLVAARTLRKYDDMPVGAVIVSMPVTSDALSRITNNPKIVLTYTDGDTVISSAALPQQVNLDLQETVDSPLAEGHFHLTFLPDQRRAQVLHWQSILSFGAIFASFLTLAALLWALRRQLAPYQTIVGGLLEYANHATELGSLRDRIAPLRRASGEVAQVADAVTQMIDTVDASFRRIAQHTDELKSMAHVDELTGITNRRGLLEAAELELSRVRRVGGRFSVILADVDHFKSVNDLHGHPIGDAVLKQIADLLEDNSRSTDTAGRWGGEEFLILCPGGDAPGASAHADNLRRIVAEATFPIGLKVTMSFGIAAWLPGESLDETIRRADQALYQAKSDGRNLVRVI